MNSIKAKIILFSFGVIAFFILYKLWDIQALNYNKYRAFAHGQQKNFRLSFGERGEIFFKEGEVLASNVNSKSVFINPKEIIKIEESSILLSDVLNIEKEEIIEKIEKSYSEINIKDNINKEEEERIKNLKIEGVYISENRKRLYPQKEMASQVLGFLGGENIGQYGIEGYYEENLKGKEIINENSLLGSSSHNSNGSNIFLTIDYNIQFISEQLLKKAKENLEIDSGTIIVMDAKTGAIMSMANFPNFDPNEYSKVNDIAIYENSAVQKFFEPGSVFKAITIAGAVDQNKITSETEYLDLGQIQIGGRTLSNYANRSYGRVNMSEVLEKSINTGAVFASQRLGNESFLDYLERFDFFNSTGIGLQGEVLSQNLEFKKGYEVNYATASFGHGINITPIQMIKSFLAFTNNGKILKPYIVEKIIDNGNTIVTKPQVIKENVISEQTALEVTKMLVNVIEKGFSKNARIPGYYIAGKTGTSQIPWQFLGVNKKGYSDKTWQSFIGYAPAYSPQFLILVKLDNPNTRTAEYSAMPIFKELTSYLINYLQIPPDYEI